MVFVNRVVTVENHGQKNQSTSTTICYMILDVANSTVRFDDKGDGLARYTIYNYQKDAENNTDYKVRNQDEARNNVSSHRQMLHIS